MAPSRTHRARRTDTRCACTVPRLSLTPLQRDLIKVRLGEKQVLQRIGSYYFALAQEVAKELEQAEESAAHKSEL